MNALARAISAADSRGVNLPAKLNSGLGVTFVQTSYSDLLPIATVG
jgi:hypothetical protein